MARKRSDGLYQKHVTIGRNADGTYLRKTVYGKTQKELDEKILEVKNQIQQGIVVMDNTTFGEIADGWVKYYSNGDDQRWVSEQYQNLKRHILPQLQDKKVKNLKKFDLQSILNQKAKEGYATSTMKKLKIIAVQVMNVAKDQGFISENPFKDVSIVEKPAKERRALTDSEVDLITDTWEGHRMGHAALIMLYCGLRRGELLALKWTDIDFANKLLNVDKSLSLEHNQPIIKAPKSEAGVRKIPIPDFLVEILQQVGKNSELVCPNADGFLMTNIAYRRAWQSYEYYLNIQAGGKAAVARQPKITVLEPITAHMLRHTYASLLYDAGVDIKSAQKYLGHSDINITLEIYTHLSERKEIEAIGALNTHLNKRLNSKPAVKKRTSRDER